VTSASGRPGFVETVLIGGAIAATLDALDAVVYYSAAQNVAPWNIFRYIASGLLGTSAFDGSMKTALLGLALQYTIAIGAAAVFYFVCLWWPALYEKPFIFGPLFGVAVFVVMHYVVVPLSRVTRREMSMGWPEFLDQIFAHTILIGLPIALMAARSARASR
jgi:uncharacterized membrane protein YagU involved in acid resistance